MRSLIHGPLHPATAHGQPGGPRRYDILADVFFFGRRRDTFQALIAATCLQPGERVLDVGCGTGYFARLLAQAVGPQGLVVGIDPSPAMISYASRTPPRASNYQFQVGTAEALEFPAEHFDVVVSSLVMHHLPEDLRVAALREMRRVLRPGGKLLVAEAQTPLHGLGRRVTATPSSYPSGLANKLPAKTWSRQLRAAHAVIKVGRRHNQCSS